MLNGVSRSSFENVVPIIENMIEKCIKTHLRTYRVSNNNCYSWQKKNLHKIFKTELYLFRFVLLTILTPGIHFKFKLLGFCNLLLIKWFSRWNMT
jgi:hypothetical protein